MWSLGVVLYILLSGQFPFLDDENLFHQIQNAQYSVSGPEWLSISESAKHMVRSLLTLRPDQRINVLEASQHPWIRGECSMKASKNIPGFDKNGNNSVNTNSTRKNAPQKIVNKTDIITTMNKSTIKTENKIQEIENSSVVDSKTKKTKKNVSVNVSGNTNVHGGNKVPQLELFTQSLATASRPPFGSCSWSYRGSQTSINSQNSQNSINSQNSQNNNNHNSGGGCGYSQCMTSPYGGRRVIPSRTNSESFDNDVSDDKSVNRIPIDGLSLFRMATGVKKVESPFLVPLSIPQIILSSSKKVGRPKNKKSDLPSNLKNEKSLSHSPGKKGKGGGSGTINTDSVAVKILDIDSTVSVPVSVPIGRSGRSYSRPCTVSTDCASVPSASYENISQVIDTNNSMSNKKKEIKKSQYDEKMKNINDNDESHTIRKRKSLIQIERKRHQHEIDNNSDNLEDAIEEFNSDCEDKITVNTTQTNSQIKSPKKKVNHHLNMGNASDLISVDISTSGQFDGNISVALTPAKIISNGFGHGYINSDYQYYISPSNSKTTVNNDNDHNDDHNNDNNFDFNINNNDIENNKIDNNTSSSKKSKKNSNDNFNDMKEHDGIVSSKNEKAVKNNKIDKKSNKENNDQKIIPSSQITTSTTATTSTSTSQIVSRKRTLENISSSSSSSSSSTVKRTNSKKLDASTSCPPVSVPVSESRKGVKRQYQSPVIHTDTDSTKTSITTQSKDSPKRKIQAISYDEKVKPTISSSKSKSTNKKVVNVTGSKTPQGVFRGTLEEAWGRSKVLVPPSSIKVAVSISTGSGCTVRSTSVSTGVIPGSGYLTRSASVLQSNTVDPAIESIEPVTVTVARTYRAEPVKDDEKISGVTEAISCSSSSSSSATKTRAGTGKGTGTGAGTKEGTGPGTGTGTGTITSAGTGTGTGVGTGRRKLRVAMKSLVEIFQAGSGTAHKEKS